MRFKFKWHRRKRKDREQPSSKQQRPSSSLLSARRSVFLWAARRGDTAFDPAILTLVSRAKEIASKSAIDDFIAWRDWDGLADKLPNFMVRQLIRKFVDYDNRSSSPSGPTIDTTTTESSQPRESGLAGEG